MAAVPAFDEANTGRTPATARSAGCLWTCYADGTLVVVDTRNLASPCCLLTKRGGWFLSVHRNMTASANEQRDTGEDIITLPTAHRGRPHIHADTPKIRRVLHA